MNPLGVLPRRLFVFGGSATRRHANGNLDANPPAIQWAYRSVGARSGRLSSCRGDVANAISRKIGRSFLYYGNRKLGATGAGLSHQRGIVTHPDAHAIR